MLNVIIKTTIIYLVIIFAMRIMGKRQLSQMQPYELVIALLIAEVTATPMDDPGTPLYYGLLPAATLIIMYYLISKLSLKSNKLRRLFEGRSSLVIDKGKICKEELAKLGYNLSDLLEQVRMAGYMDISEVDYAILETGGNLSVFPSEKNSNVTLSDLGIKPKRKMLTYPLVLDGEYEKDAMEKCGIKYTDIKKALAKENIKNVKDVFYLSFCDGKRLFVQTQDGKTVNIHIKNKQE